MTDTKTKDAAPEYYRSVTDGDLTQPMELDEFLTGVGVVLRLPPKKDENEDKKAAALAAAAAADEAKSAAAKSRRGQKSLIVAVCATASAILLAFIGLRAWNNRYSDVMPSTLIGSWQTDAVKYKDRGFVVTTESLQMKRGPKPSDVATLPIKSVRVRNAQRGRSVHITYEENGVTQAIDLTLEDLDGMSIVAVHNQPDIIWKRK
jgi:hypothetical protein